MVWPAQSLEHNPIDVDNLIIWYVRSSCQTNTTCEKRFGKHRVKFLWNASAKCQRSARLWLLQMGNSLRKVKFKGQNVYFTKNVCQCLGYISFYCTRSFNEYKCELWVTPNFQAVCIWFLHTTLLRARVIKSDELKEPVASHACP